MGRSAYDPGAAVAALTKSDPVLGQLMDRVGPCRLGVRPALSTFQEILRAIIYQQLSGHAAASIYARVCGLFPARRAPNADDILAVSVDTLRGAGLSRAKAAAAKDLAARTKRRSIPGVRRLRNMSDEEIVACLTAVRGVGPWTVEMFLMFKLGRPDVLPATDLGVRKGFELLYRCPALPPPSAVLEHGERWRPFRTVAAWYLWRAVELDRAGEQVPPLTP